MLSNVVLSGDIRFITCFGGTLARDDYCAGVSIKYSTYNSRLDSLCSLVILGMPRQISIHYWSNGISILAHCGNINILARI